MDYCEFVGKLTECIEEKMAGKNASVDIRKVVKVNDMEKDGLTICEPGQLAAATVYIDDLYPLLDEGIDINEIAEKVIAVHESGRQSVPEQFFAMYEFEKARDSVTCRLVNTAVNQKYLEDVPHVNVMDLSVIFYCTYMYGDEGHIYTSKITNQLMEKWSIDVDTLYELAKRNTAELFGISLEEIGDVCREMLKNQHVENETDLMDSLNKDNRTKMFILTNRMKNSGAVNMLIGDSMKKISDYFDDDLIIIPSSIHEVLLLPARSGMKKKEIDHMIASVNMDVLRTEDILSDHSYYYSREADRITM